MGGDTFEAVQLDEDEEHIFLYLLLLLFCMYLVLSVLATAGQYFMHYIYRIHRHGLRFQDTSLYMLAVLLFGYILPQHGISPYDALRRLGANALVLLSPLLRRLLRSGGQVIRYALSSYYVLLGAEDLSSAELLLRGFTLVLATVVFLIFVVPVALGVLHYLVPIVRTYKSAFHQREPPDETSPSSDDVKRTEAGSKSTDAKVDNHADGDDDGDDDDEMQWICPFCTEINAIRVEACTLCEVPRLDEAVVVTRNSEEKGKEKGKGKGKEKEGKESVGGSKIWRIQQFDMNSYYVLCQLGSGVTCLVTLVRIDQRSTRRRRVPMSDLSVLREEPQGFDVEDSLHVVDSGYHAGSLDGLKLAHAGPSNRMQGSPLNSMRKSSTIAMGLGAIPAADDSSQAYDSDLDSTDAEATSQEAAVLGRSSSPRLGEGLKRAAVSVPSELYMQGDEWRQTNVKWVNQELSPVAAKASKSSRLGLSNSGVPYADIDTSIGESCCSMSLTPTELDHEASPPRDKSPNGRPRSRVRSEGGEKMLNPDQADNAREVELLPKLVAIKIIEKQKLEVMGMRENIEREIDILRQCESPFVCRMFNAFQDDFCVYLILEPVGGGDLKGLLQQYAVLYEREAKFYVACLLLALEHLQQKRIVCMDVKPENLLLDQWGFLKLTDFGVARMFEKKHSANRGDWPYVGTLEYISPEVVMSQPVSDGFGCSSPDIWAAGILIYEMLVGETPFVGADDRETKHHIVTYCEEYLHQQDDSGWLGFSLRRPTPQQQELDWKGGRMSEETQELVLKLLHVDPAKRLGFESVTDILQDPWFMDDPDFDWQVIRDRGPNAAPLVPEPSSLSPPFRNSNTPEDITGNDPMSIAEFQTAYEKSNESDPGHFMYPSGVQRHSWTGIPQAIRPAVNVTQAHIDHTLELCRIGECAEEGVPMF